MLFLFALCTFGDGGEKHAYKVGHCEIVVFCVKISFQAVLKLHTDVSINIYLNYCQKQYINAATQGDLEEKLKLGGQRFGYTTSM